MLTAQLYHRVAGGRTWWIRPPRHGGYIASKLSLTEPTTQAAALGARKLIGDDEARFDRRQDRAPTPGTTFMTAPEITFAFNGARGLGSELYLATTLAEGLCFGEEEDWALEAVPAELLADCELLYLPRRAGGRLAR